MWQQWTRSAIHISFSVKFKHYFNQIIDIRFQNLSQNSHEYLYILCFMKETNISAMNN